MTGTGTDQIWAREGKHKKQRERESDTYIPASNASLVQKRVFCPQSGVCEALVRKT